MIKRTQRMVLSALAIVFLSISTTAGTPAVTTAHATSFTPGTLLSSGCSSWLEWRGNSGVDFTYRVYVGDPRNWPLDRKTGTVRFCAWKFRIDNEKVKAQDYYYVKVKTEFAGYDKKSQGSRGGPWSVSVKSSQNATSNDYHASPTVTSPSSSPWSVSVGAGWGFASIGVGYQFKEKGITIRRTSNTVNSASWGSNAKDITVAEHVYAQAVKAKTVPKYTVVATYPNFRYRYLRKCSTDPWCTRPTFKKESTQTSTKWTVVR
ncbi:hypothetical protein IGS67_05250 [Flavimobilis sp. GY10621]|uniref:Fibronectin type-III domain-containing protein n=1 Tax=Flavimobilis rhizosphaerae TaxID=2775421 RepID=A0ABR9DP58_9MICO|nr:hypothetical protein [Flavimobilis rhizosphaerae]MBD9698900.1 hypothetical protein [Flavimobilis rhizosphaerae]